MAIRAHSELAKRPRLSRSQTEALEQALAAEITGEVRFDDGSRALYATDSSNYRQAPIGVVIPRNRQDVVKTVAWCHAYGAPVLLRGGGTSLAGQCCNHAVVIDTGKYLRRLLELDPEKKQARVEPGLVLDDLRQAAEPHRLTFAPDPSTHDHCTLGGMIGNNSCGTHSVMGGNTVDNVEELTVLTYDGLELTVGATSERELETIISGGGRRGEIYGQLKRLRDSYAGLIRKRYPKIPRRVSGYNLDQLLPEKGFHVARALVGTECTCVIVLEALCRLVYSPPSRAVVVLGYEDVYSAGAHAQAAVELGALAVEGLDDRLVGLMKKRSNLHPEYTALLPEGGGWLVVEVGGQTREEARAAAERVAARRRDLGAGNFRIYDDQEQQKHLWKVREAGLGATAFAPGEPLAWEGWEDSAVPPAKLGDYLRELRQLLEKYQYECVLYGHFGQGCVHTRIDFDLFSAAGIKRFRAFVREAAHLVASYGGSLSGEHGDGQSRGELLPIMFGDELVRAFGEFKAIWDPQGRMNPGKVVAPYRVDENLRLEGYRPWKPKTYFRFPQDPGGLGYAAMRCVGVGKCRREEGGVMCPSFQVTKEERHSTRGRAHLLFEMMRGETIESNWRNEAVREALDLCLACKGCKSECPVNVDMASYKAEFLSHYYAGRLRPRAAYAMGWIHRWARVAQLCPELANLGGHLPGAKKLAGLAPQRELPRFAKRNFQSWYAGRRRKGAGRMPVLLWPDTFNNYFLPQTAEAAVEVLEAAGFSVEVPRLKVCCGRPLYDYGMLDTAKRMLQRTLRQLRPQIRAGTPMVVLEPSCAAVFLDEMLNLLPDDADAQRLSRQTYLFGELLDKFAPEFDYPEAGLEAMVQVHCHQRGLVKEKIEQEIVKRAGFKPQVLEKGCCGMAGSFGYESQHYELSQQVGEHGVLPTVRGAAAEAVIIADGFSCREQIQMGTGRRALHLAEAIHMGLHRGGDCEVGRQPWLSTGAKVALAGGAVAAALGVWGARKR